ncbi:class E sortase [Streptomyces sp. SL13]|uniref:Class E sortase n=1 Tax=Streptantibioticus silvisoli TaxID=2705255 RepID=A0AA90H9P9_9ACTN|nr:class E sortase [Streptantibioticus silvisoli]MDI5964316.1 class E sortase [Streptantibioticus silvisoli]MDI5970582.1 class E sortase [Streptantibioticus silvisoli]
MATTEHDQNTGDSGADATPRAAGGRARGRIAATISLLGELLITAGLVLALFVAYSLWWTNVIADRQENHEAATVRKHWAQAPKDVPPGKLDTKDGIGFLHVPAMGKGYELLVKRGTSVPVLNQGVAGYYVSPEKSAMPWDTTGNFTIAAHRDGHGAKFHNIDKIKKGDAIVFETRDTWYIYKVYDVLDQTSKFNVHVIDQVPKESGKKKPGRYITLTTCTPVYTSLYRYVVWGELVGTQKVDAKRTPPAALGG